MALVSIVIPTYNRRQLIGYTLDSVAPQHHAGVDLEVIVVDDHSDDDTVDFIARKYPMVTVLVNPGMGAPSARNHGLRHAHGDYVLFVDSDDLVGPDFLFTKVEWMEHLREVDAVYGGYEFFRSDDLFEQKDVVFKHKYPIIAATALQETHLSNYLGGFFLPPLAILWRKTFLDKLGGQDESLIINQDVELFIRALARGMLLTGIDDDKRVYVRHHELDSRVGSAAQSEGKYREILELRKRLLVMLEGKKMMTTACREAMSRYLFDRWREIRQIYPALAGEYLALSKKVFWPLELRGGAVLKMMAKILGPVRTVALKDLMAKKQGS